MLEIKVKNKGCKTTNLSSVIKKETTKKEEYLRLIINSINSNKNKNF